jgi:pimeloyl-ACP methyl ester carboxylesterase
VLLMRIHPWPRQPTRVEQDHPKAQEPRPPSTGPLAIHNAAKAHARELRMMAKAVTSAPWELLSGRPEGQGDALHAVPFSTVVQRPTSPATRAPRARGTGEGSRTLAPTHVLLVHGLASSTSVWLEMAEHLQARGVTVAALSYRSFGTSVEQLAERVAGTVETLLAETGADKVHLVGHSLGGVVIAQAFADGRLTGLVDSVVTIAAPFGGSPWATVLPVGATIRALRQGSPQLCRLAVAPVPVGMRWLAICSNQDLIVPGRRSMPPQAGIENVTIDGVGHMGLLSNPHVIEHVLSTILATPLTGKRAVA